MYDKIQVENRKKRRYTTAIFRNVYRQAEVAMALSDTFIRQIKPSKPSGDKHCDGGGLYLFVKGGGRYWRLDYRYLNKRKTLSLGTYPEVSLAKARKRRDDARVLLADDIDPAQARRADREARL